MKHFQYSVQGHSPSHYIQFTNSDVYHKTQSASLGSQVDSHGAQGVYSSPRLSTGHPVRQEQQGCQPPPEDPNIYGTYPSPISLASSSSQRVLAESRDPMAAAQMQQRPYQPMYHTPQSNSPASVASPQGHDQHGRGMYGQPPPQMSTPMYGYPQYSPLSQVHSSPYGHLQHPSHTQLTSQPMPIHPTAPPQMSHPQVASHTSGMTNSPRMKLEPAQPQSTQPPARLPMSQAQSTPSLQSASAKTDYSSRDQQSSHGSVNASSAPGPIPATTPLVVRQDNNGVQWIAFEYSRDRVKLEYTIRCDVESVNVEDLSQEFKAENCVYPRACCTKEQYRGNRLNYETECNAVGWALAELNTCLRGKRGLIQRAVDSWRNSNQDVRLRSRRVRRQAKMTSKKGPIHTGPMSAPNMGNGMSAPTGGLTTPTGRVPTTMPMAAPQFSHHHGHTDGPEAKHEDLNDYPGTTQSQRMSQSYQPSPHTDLRHSQIFHGYPAYPTAAGSEPSMAPAMHHAMDSLGRPVGNAAVVSADRSDEVDEKDVFGDLPDGKRRKFILVDNAGKRIRVKVMLDQVNVSEIPESYRKKYSVFPRSFNSTDGGAVQEEPRYRRYFNDEGADNGESIVTRTSVPAPLPDGTDGQVQVPCISRSKHQKEEILNNLGHRMCWSQSRTFEDRHLFLQRSLDAYRDKMRSSIIGSGQDESVSPHFERRQGKRRWADIEKRASDAPMPAAPKQ